MEKSHRHHTSQTNDFPDSNIDLNNHPSGNLHSFKERKLMLLQFLIMTIVTLASVFSALICAVDLQTETHESERSRLQIDLIISIIAILMTSLALYN